MKGLAHRHLHKRRQLQEKSEFWGQFLDKVVLGTGIVAPFMVAPQLIQIFSTQNAVGVSTLSWLLFGILDIPFILYGVMHKDIPIITTYSLWLAANLAVVAGTLLYG